MAVTNKKAVGVDPVTRVMDPQVIAANTGLTSGKFAPGDVVAEVVEDVETALSTAEGAASVAASAVQSVTGGTNVTITGTPTNPIINASGGEGSADWGEIGGTLSDQTDLQGALNAKADASSLGSAAAANVEDFATAAQGSAADTAVQPGDLATVATTGAYSDLSGTPTLGTAAAQDTTAFDAAGSASAAQAAAVQRANHTGTQAISTITGLQTALDGRVGIDSGIVVVAAGDNLSTARPTAAVVYWVFDDDAVDVGAGGVNIVNAEPGDLWFVPNG